MVGLKTNLLRLKIFRKNIPLLMAFSTRADSYHFLLSSRFGIFVSFHFSYLGI